MGLRLLPGRGGMKEKKSRMKAERPAGVAPVEPQSTGISKELET